MNKLGGALVLSLMLTGCIDTKEAKLRRAVQCREFADKDLANLKVGLDPEITSASLEESFYSNERSSCVAVITQLHWARNHPEAGAAVEYDVVDSVSNRRIIAFLTDGNGKNFSATDANVVEISTNARTAVEDQIKQWR